MSQENVELVRRMYEAFHAGEAERALGYFDPEVGGNMPLGGGLDRLAP